MPKLPDCWECPKSDTDEPCDDCTGYVADLLYDRARDNAALDLMERAEQRGACDCR